LGEVRQRRLALRRGAHLVALAGQHRPQHPCDLRLIVDDQHARLFVRCQRHHVLSLLPFHVSRLPSHRAAALLPIGIPRSISAFPLSPAAGSVITIAVPRPDRGVSIAIWPPWVSTRRRAIGSPRPTPPRFGSCDSRSGTRKNFSNTRSRSSGGMPGPSSQTRMRTLCGSSAVASTVMTLPGGAYLLALSSRI